MSEAENESKQNLEEASQPRYKADGDDRVVSKATDMLNLDTEDKSPHGWGPNNNESDQGPMLIIAGEYQSSFE